GGAPRDVLQLGLRLVAGPGEAHSCARRQAGPRWGGPGLSSRSASRLKRRQPPGRAPAVRLASLGGPHPPPRPALTLRLTSLARRPTPPHGVVSVGSMRIWSRLPAVSPGDGDRIWSWGLSRRRRGGSGQGREVILGEAAHGV